MNELEDATHLLGAEITPAQARLQQKLGLTNSDNNDVKTPRRGLGLVINEAKTPGAKSHQSLSFSIANKSTFKKQAVMEESFTVFQDDSVKEDEIMEEKAMEEVKKEEQRPVTPIEKASRCSLGHDSVGDYLEELQIDQDCSILEDNIDYPNMFEEDSIRIESSDSEAEEDDDDKYGMSNEEAIERLGVEKWDEYPPIDPPTRMATAEEINWNLADYLHESEDVVLDDGIDDQLQNMYIDDHERQMFGRRFSPSEIDDILNMIEYDDEIDENEDVEVV